MRFLSMRHCKYLTTQWLCCGMRGLISPSPQIWVISNQKTRLRFFRSFREDSFSKNHIELGLRLQKTLPSTWMSWDKSLASHCPPSQSGGTPQSQGASWTSICKTCCHVCAPGRLDLSRLCVGCLLLPCQNQFTQINLTYGSFIWHTNNYSIYIHNVYTSTHHLHLSSSPWKCLKNHGALKLKEPDVSMRPDPVLVDLYFSQWWVCENDANSLRNLLRTRRESNRILNQYDILVRCYDSLQFWRMKVQCISMYTTKSSSWVQINFIIFQHGGQTKIKSIQSWTMRKRVGS